MPYNFYIIVFKKFAYQKGHLKNMAFFQPILVPSFRAKMRKNEFELLLFYSMNVMSTTPPK